MRHTIAAIRSGSEPAGPLPAAAFHRWLEEPVYCPKCDVSYQLVAGYDWAVNLHFPEEARRHLALLRKAISQGHSENHSTSHYETNGVSVSRISKSANSTELRNFHALEPMSKLIN